ncbi:hypothetical protein C8R43DRAFT_1140437 [Mycena crocata]|nr:hypothetical protein C8R43DRAFT_1140437 [Mycena crocata]
MSRADLSAAVVLPLPSLDCPGKLRAGAEGLPVASRCLVLSSGELPSTLRAPNRCSSSAFASLPRTPAREAIFTVPAGWNPSTALTPFLPSPPVASSRLPFDFSATSVLGCHVPISLRRSFFLSLPSIAPKQLRAGKDEPPVAPRHLVLPPVELPSTLRATRSNLLLVQRFRLPFSNAGRGGRSHCAGRMEPIHSAYALSPVASRRLLSPPVRFFCDVRFGMSRADLSAAVVLPLPPLDCSPAASRRQG